MAYTYDDFVKAAQDAGVYAGMNESDLSTAKNNPEFGLSMVSLQKDLNAATTPEQKMLATEAANQLRKTYGGYTLSDTGEKSFAGNYGPAVKAQLEKVTNPTPFSYNPDEDQMLSQYRKTYLREGERASENALGQAAALTQGRPSSYAVSAANQAGNYYAAQLADAIPQMEQNAYNRYLAGLQQDAATLEALRGQDETEYQRYLKGIDIQNQELSQAMSLYQLLGKKAPEWALAQLGMLPTETKKSGSSGGGGYAYAQPGSKEEIKALQTELNNKYGAGLAVDGVYGQKTAAAYNAAAAIAAASKAKPAETKTTTPTPTKTSGGGGGR